MTYLFGLHLKCCYIYSNAFVNIFMICNLQKMAVLLLMNAHY